MPLQPSLRKHRSRRHHRHALVDLASRSLFFDALIDGATKQHFIYSLDVDTGDTAPGWPVDVNATASYDGMNFRFTGRRKNAGALALVNGIVYVSYSGYIGDSAELPWLGCGCGYQRPYLTWSLGDDAVGGGIWGHGGVASDGTNMFVVTGNTFNTGGIWMGGEAIIRLQAGPIWTGQPTDYWVPTTGFAR